jgi:uncharacterized protein YkwD
MVPSARLALISAAVAMSAALACVSLAPTVASADDPQLDRQERWVLGTINQYRQQAGAPALQSSSTLSVVAERYAELLAARGVLSHTLDGSSTERAARAGWVGPVSDILAFSTASDAPAMWYASSDGHREAMLTSFADVAGVGTDTKHDYWVVMFGNCGAVSPEVCAATGDFGDATGDITRWQAEDAGVFATPPPRTQASRKASGLRVLSAKAKGRTLILTVSTRQTAQGELSVGATSCCARTNARLVSKRARGGRMLYTYRVRVHKRGRYQLWASFSGRGAWTDGHAERWYDIS